MRLIENDFLGTNLKPFAAWVCRGTPKKVVTERN